jgi:hypothetical protein
MDDGVPTDKAYDLALQEYRKIRVSREIQDRVAQEQFLDSATVPPSSIIEELLLEEKRALESVLER